MKSFSTRTDAKKWARAIERKLDTGNYTDYSEASKFLLGDLFKRYVNENKHKKLRSWKMYEFRINILLKDTIADINLLRLSSKHLAEFRDRKLQEGIFSSRLSYHDTDTGLRGKTGSQLRSICDPKVVSLKKD